MPPKSSAPIVICGIDHTRPWVRGGSAMRRERYATP
jgi:hypothetical protein